MLKQLKIKRYCVREEFDDWFGTNICKEFDFKQEIVSYKYLNKAAFVD